MSDLRVVIAGAGGRMGRTLIRAVSETNGFVVAGALDAASSPHIGEDSGVLAGLPANNIKVTSDAEAALKAAHCLLDFTIPAATVAYSAVTAKTRCVHVIGTTGLGAIDEKQIADAAIETVIVKSGNMSLGVNLLAALTKKVAAALDADFDIEVLEMHHNQKIDAPSGTALLLGRAAAEGRGIDLDKHAQRVRDGHTGARTRGDIGFATLRGGSVIGEHTVMFASGAERIELTHKASDRTLFANGALKAAAWGRKQKPGLYSMMDVLGLSD
jgi:4-hydroxy-tetrahydrodipicolinate reductase